MSKYTKEISVLPKKDIKWMVILSIIVLLPNLFLAFYGNDIAKSSIFKIATDIVVSVFLFLLPSLFLKMRIFFIFQGIFVLFAPLEIAHVYLNRMPVTTAFLLSIVDTDWNESTEVLASLKVPLFLLFLLWGFYLYIAVKKIKNTYLFHSMKIRGYFIGAFLVVFFAGYSFYFLGEYPNNKKEVFKSTNERFLTASYKIYPYGLIINMYKVYATKREIKNGWKQIQNFRFNAYKADTVDEKEVYVFVIGETSRYSSYSINGYGRETSPLLSKTKNLISYSDLFSEANITSSSLPTILTRASAVDYNRAFVEKSFVDAFQEAGFKTYWIANQSASNRFIQRIAKDVNEKFFTTINFETDTNYDEKLWDYLSEVLKKEDRKVLIVLHTLGSHFRYNFRYPPKYELFKPCLKGSFDYNMISVKNKEIFINTYDNSIVYTDYFLATTIQKMDSLGAISALAFVSDHGENLFDTPENRVLHGGSNFTKYDFHVPCFIWTSDKYNQQYPSKVENLIRNKDKKLTTNNLFYSFLDIANITFSKQVLAKSIASPYLKEDSVRYVITTNMEVVKGF